MPSAASISSDIGVALTRGAPQRPQFAASQPDAQPFAALLDAATAPTPPTPDSGAAAGAPATAAPAGQQPASADGGANPQADNNSASAPGAGPSPKMAPAQSANTGTSAPAPAAGNGAAPVQSSKIADAHKAPQTSQNPANRNQYPAGPNSGTALTTGSAKTTATDSLINDGNAASTAGGANTNSTTNGQAPPANTTATPASAANDGTDTAGNAAVAAAFNAAVNATGAVPAASGTPAAAKTLGGKDDKSDQNSAATDPTSDPPSANQAQLPSPEAAQPVAVAITGSTAADAGSPVAKTGPMIADAVKARVKAMPAAAPADQNTPAQDGNTDQTAAAAATDSSGTDGSTPAASDATAGNASASAIGAQQTPDQQPTPGATTATLLTQIDFASSSGAERLGARAEATALNSVGASAAPASATTNAVPNFGVFAANAMTANGATAAAASGNDTPVPLAGLAVAIAARAQAGSSQFDIRLDPPELGRIDVRLGVDGSGQVTTHVTVDRADTLQLLQSQQPQLQQALEQAGLKTADNGLQFTLRDQPFAGQNGGSGGQQQQAAPPTQLVIPEPNVAPVDTAQIYARLRLGSGLDIRV